MHKDSLIKRASKSKAKVSRNSLFQFSWKDSSRNQWPLLLLHETPGYLTIKRKKEKLGGGDRPERIMDYWHLCTEFEDI